MQNAAQNVNWVCTSIYKSKGSYQGNISIIIIAIIM